MVYNDKEDENEPYHWIDDKYKYDEVILDSTNIPEGDKDKYIVSITSNDDVMHLPSLKKAIYDSIINVMDEETANRIVDGLIEDIKKEERMQTSMWQFSIPLIGPQFDGLIIQVYPTWQSWEHVRDRNKEE